MPSPSDRVAFRPLPRLAVRLSFNDTYAITDGDSRRSVVAADWPTAMFAFNDYMGIEVSLLDPIAPLAEMALRPAGTYHGYPYVALDVLRPRFGGWICVPQFSRRLTLSSGFGARFLDVQREHGDGSARREVRRARVADVRRRHPVRVLRDMELAVHGRSKQIR